MNSEFNGRPEQASLSEAQFWRSMEELLPILEREGIHLALEPHPDDFIEDGVDRREHGPRHELPQRVIPVLRAAHLPPGREPGRDHRDRRPPPDPRPCRRHLRPPRVVRACATSSTRPGRPPASTSISTSGRARCRGTRSSARSSGLRFDGILTVCVFAWEERARESSLRNLEEIRRRIGSWAHLT